MNRTERLVGAYCEIAAPLLAGIRPRNTCISQTRITVECFKRLGVAARPVCTSLAVLSRDMNLVYLSGFTEKERARMRAQSASWHDALDPEPGWRGHVCALIAGRWFIDSTLDQASQPDRGMPIDPDILVIPCRQYRPGRTRIDGRIITNAGLKLEVSYIPKADRTFLTTEAWELLPHMDRMCAAICARMTNA